MTPQEAAEQYASLHCDRMQGYAKYLEAHLAGQQWQSEQDNQALSSALKEIAELHAKVKEIQQECDIYEGIVSNSFGIITNMNDTFAYACAQAGEIDCNDISKLIDVIKKYGYDDVTTAYESLRIQQYPIKPYLTEAFYELREILSKMNLECNTSPESQPKPDTI